MKRIKYLTLGAAGLLLASCSQEQIKTPLVAEKGEGNLSVKLMIPASMVTRDGEVTAFGTGKVANNLHFALYDANAENAFIDYDVTTATFTQEGDYLSTEVYLDLAAGKTYNIAFFAQSEASEVNGVYTFNGEEKNVTVDYNAMTSAENLADAYDCFYNVLKVTPSSKVTSAEVELTRPVAQINWGTSEFKQAEGQDAVKDDSAFGPNGEYLTTYLSVTAYDTLDLLTGAVSGSQEINFTAPFEAPCDETPAVAFPYEPSMYSYVAMNYILAPAKESNLMDITLTIMNNGKDSEGNQGNSDINQKVTVAQVPYQANFRTNIYGNLLSTQMDIKVVKVPTWGEPDYVVSTQAVEPPMVDGKYEVSTQGHLNWMAENVSDPQYNGFADQNFVLGQDLYLTEDITPIGTSNAPFKGTFDGNEKTIHNLTYSYTGNAQYAGLFGVINGAVVENFTIENVTINNEGGEGAFLGQYIGAVVGNVSSGTVQNIEITGKVDINAPKGYYIGGFIGRNGGSTIKYLKMNVTDAESIILGGNYVGGIIGLNNIGVAEMNNLESNVTISGSSYVGGIIGLIGSGISGEKDVTLSNSKNYGEIINRSTTNAANGYYIGGIAGGWSNLTNTTVIFDDCYNYGNLSWPNWTGSDSDDFEYRTKNDITGVGSNRAAQGTLIINDSENVAADHWYPDVKVEEPGENSGN